MSTKLALKEKALALGFDLVGIASAGMRDDLAFARRWVEMGYGGEMEYLANPKRADLRQVLPSAKSVICVALIYNTPYPYSTEVYNPREPSQKDAAGDEDPPSGSPPRAWISRYAWGRDYHRVLRTKLEALRTMLTGLTAGVETRVFVDTGPVVERAFARLSGIGWMGKNTCLINEQKGSWFFLGVVLTNLELELDLPAPDRCGTCTRCLDACPTGALVEPYVMDASRCIAYFNIELKGAIPEEFRKAIGANVVGCDICQDVCPWNSRPSFAVGDSLLAPATPDGNSKPGSAPRHAAATELSEFQPLQVETKSIEAFSLFNPTLESLASITEEDFKRLFARSPIKRVKFRGWLRNLCVAMGNSGDPRFIPWLEAAANNSDPIVQEHAAWALSKLRTTT